MVQPSPTATAVVHEYGTGYGILSWRGAFAGALCGFALTMILSTLGAAIGITAGEPVADTEGAETAARSVGLGAALWWILTVLVVGFVGGRAYSRVAGNNPTYAGERPPVLIPGTVVWITGSLILVTLLVLGASNLLGSAGAVMGYEETYAGATTREAETAVDAAKGGMWALLLSMLVGWGATLLGVRSPRLAARTADAGVFRRVFNPERNR